MRQKRFFKNEKIIKAKERDKNWKYNHKERERKCEKYILSKFLKCERKKEI